MTIPKNFGISKISHMRGAEETRYEGREGSSSSSSRGMWDTSMQQGQLSFELNSANDAVALLSPPSFNVLYIQTPKIALLQTPQFRAAAQLWEETLELVRPLLRFGFPETSLKTKCPHYNDKLYESSAGALLANDRTRTLLRGIRSGCIGHVQNHGHNHGHSSSHGASHHQQQQSEPQQQQPPPVGMFGFSTLAFLASQVAGGMRQQAAQHKQHQESEQRGVETAQLVEQHPEHAIPKSRLLVPDIPSGTLVLALNLGAYWMITKQARRSSMGGSMTG